MKDLFYNSFDYAAFAPEIRCIFLSTTTQAAIRPEICSGFVYVDVFF